MSENRGKPQENQGTDIPLADFRAPTDNYYEMIPAALPRIDLVNVALAKLRTQAERITPGDSLPWRLYNQVRLAIMGRRFWGIVRNAESNTAKLEKAWSDCLELAKSLTSYYPRFPAHDELIGIFEEQFERSNLDEEARALKDSFPRQVARLLATVDRSKQLYKNLIVVLAPKDDLAAIEDAERQYKNGELLDLETFINGVHGVR